MAKDLIRRRLKQTPQCVTCAALLTQTSAVAWLHGTKVLCAFCYTESLRKAWLLSLDGGTSEPEEVVDGRWYFSDLRLTAGSTDFLKAVGHSSPLLGLNANQLRASIHSQQALFPLIRKGLAYETQSRSNDTVLYYALTPTGVGYYRERLA